MDISFNPIQQTSLELMTKLTDQLSEVDSSDPVGSFKEILEIMMPIMTLQSFSSSMGMDSQSGQNNFGINLNLIMAPVMMTLMEELMSKQLSALDEGAQESEVAKLVEVGDLSAAKAIHVNQFEAERLAGGDGANANCGPTSLVIALRALGIDLAEAQSGGNAGTAVDMARQMMVADPARDGIGANGGRSEAEHSTWTNFGDLARGASAAGVENWPVTPDSHDIRKVLEEGGKVIISGTFTGKYPLPWTGDRGTDNSSAPGGATGHIVAVTGLDEKGNFIVNDPARKTPLIVSGQTLDNFMSGNAGAMGLKP